MPLPLWRRGRLAETERGGQGRGFASDLLKRRGFAPDPRIFLAR